MLMYLNLHAALDQMREKAKKNPGLTGPRVCSVVLYCPEMFMQYWSFSP